MHAAVFLVIFVLHNSGCSVERLVTEMQPITRMYDTEVGESSEFARSVYYVIRTKAPCVRVSGDKSLFHERFLASIQPYIPPAVVSDSRNIYKCNVTILAAQDANALWDTITTQPLWSRVRFYCLVNNATLESLRSMFKNITEVFKDAEVAIFVVNHYETGLKISPPHNKMEVFHVPSQGFWDVKDATPSKTVIRFTTGNCDIHGTVNGNVSGLDPYTPGNFGGTDWRVFSRIAQLLNWEMKYVHTTSEQYLGEYNGTWKGGMLGALVDNQVDVAFCGIWIDWRKLSEGIQMSVPMAKVCIQYIVPRPVISDRNTPVARCFSSGVYALLLATLIVTSLTLNVMNRVDKYFVPSKDKGYRSWKYCFMVTWGIFCQGNYPSQSADIGSVRRIILLWSVLSMLMACSFSSKLVSNFSHPTYTRKPSNVHELVEFGYRAPYYAEDEVFPWGGVFSSELSYQREWLSRSDTIHNFDEFIERLKTWPKQALIGTMYDKYIFIPGSKLPGRLPPEIFEKYETMDKCVRIIYEGFAVRQGSRFYQKINKYLTYFKQYGMLKKIYKGVIEELAKEEPGLWSLTVKTVQGLKPLSLEQLSGIFRTLAIGMALSVVVFLCEILQHRIQKHKQNNLPPYGNGTGIEWFP